MAVVLLLMTLPPGSAFECGPCSRREFVGFDDCFHKRLRRFLWKVVSDTAADGSVLVLADELRRVGVRVGMGRAVRVAFQGDRRDGDVWCLGEVRFELVVL